LAEPAEQTSGSYPSERPRGPQAHHQGRKTGQRAGRGQGGTQWCALPAPDCACSCGEIQYEPSGFVGGGLRGVHLRGPPGPGGDRAGARGACGVSCGVAPRLGGPLRGDARWGAHSDPAWPMRCGFEAHIGRRRYRPGREHGSTPIKHGQVCALAGQVLWLVLLERPPSS